MLGVSTAAPAFAHQLSRGAADVSTGEFFLLGVQHMLLGWDHLLFIAGVLLLSRTWQMAAKLITVFVLGYLALFPRVGDTVDLTLPAGSTCSVEINTDPLPTGALGDPPLQGFWEPTETTPIRTFEHARTDGSLTIYYPRSAGSTELAAIESLALSAEGRGILAGSASQQQVDYRFKTFHEVLVCTEFEEETMRRFAQAWFATL